tara:strand:- start:39 stop:1322 length:1284 start_codon:yes stop_codon:yes gene_type:complete
MPVVAGKEYPYTEEGIAAAEAARSASPIQLDAERDLGLYELALAAAQAGALGGAVSGNVGRAGLSYEDWLRGVKGQPVVFRGLSAAVDDPMASRPGYAAFASNNPATALSYAGDPRIKDVLGDPSTGVGAAVHPIRLSPAKRRGSLRDYSWLAKPRGAFDMVSFDDAARMTLPGEAVVIRDVYDPGPKPTGEGGRSAGFRQDTYGWTHPEGLASPASAPMSAEEVAGLMHRSAERAGLEGGRFSGPGRVIGKGYDLAPEREKALTDDLLANLGAPEPNQSTEKILWPESESFSQEDLRRVLAEVPNDPRFQPSKRARAIQLLKSAAKEAIRPKNVITDALIGSVLGAGSALAGYEWSRPRSAGVFTPPGPGYEDALTQADILAIAESKELEREARRQQYIEEARAAGFVVSDNARIEDLAEVLGPIR